ncbi:hypothetical protein ES707_13396 [subsurface metagenome]
MIAGIFESISAITSPISAISSVFGFGTSSGGDADRAQRSAKSLQLKAQFESVVGETERLRDSNRTIAIAAAGVVVLGVGWWIFKRWS